MRTKSSSFRNVTLSAQADLIDKARQIASKRGLSLNDAFRAWLDSYARHPDGEPHPYEEFIASLGNVKLGPMPTREERNQRGA